MQPWGAEVRAQLRLALPVVFIQLGLMTMGAVDGAFLGRVSAVEYAAVSIGHTWTFLFLAFGMGVLTSLDPVVSQARGAGDAGAVGRAIQRGLLLALCLSIPIGLATWPAEFALTAFGQEPDVVPIATEYARISILSIPAFLMFVSVRQSLQALHHLAPLVFVILAANLLNAALDWVLIGGHLGCPPLGAVGSAWGTVLARWAMLAAILLLAREPLRPYLRASWDRVLLVAPLGRMLRLGLPVGGSFVIEVGTFSIVGFLIGSLGASEVAGHQAALTIASASFMVPLGISQAAAVRVGYETGRGDALAVRRAAGVALSGAGLVMLGFAAAFFVLPEPLARIFTDLDDVLLVAVTLLPIAAVFQVFDGTQVAAIGVLRGLGDTRIPMLIHIVGFWCIGLPLGIYLTFEAGAGARGLWWGLAAGLGAVAIAQFVRLHRVLARGDWRVKIEDEAPLGT